MSILERMARAYCADYGSDPNEWHESHHRHIRAALRAVRPEDVSDEMVEAAMNSYFDGVYSKSDAQTPVGDAFRRAIAAAIAAGGE